MTAVTNTHRIDLRGHEDLALVIGVHGRRRVVGLGPDPVVVGRHTSCDVVIDDRTVSARHCEILCNAHGAPRVRDLGSRNGTRVNGVRVDDGPLWNGARLGVGRVTLICIRRPTAASSESAPGGLVGASAAMVALRADLACFAAREAPVLITGESGTGKELAARAVHELSPRRQGPFISFNCGAFAAELAPSELFGHEKGAFTGAVSAHRGAFEQADGGTLFLDEIGELAPALQASLLRILETGMLRRVGSEQERPVSVRIVSASNRDLPRAIETGRFRLDLFHRLAVFQLHMPALRERLDDLPALSSALLERVGADVELGRDALAVLRRHRWPGNVRELRNVLERAAALARGPRVTPEDLRFHGVEMGILSDDERALLAVVEKHGGNVAAAARELGIQRTTLRDRVYRARERRPASY